MYLLAVSALALASSTPVPVQQDPWQPWYGCWRAEGAPTGEAVCIQPDGGGIRMLTLAGGVIRADSRVIADGRTRNSEREGCDMLESARWSADGQRVFLAAELTCGGQVARRSRGLLAFTGAREWLSVQTIAGEEGTAVRTVRFRPAPEGSVPAALAAGMRAAHVQPIDEGDVIEATDHLDPESVQEWLRAARAPFQLADDVTSTRSSALDDLAYASRPVSYDRVTVVRVLEPRFCIYDDCSWLRSYSCWSPWGYDRFAWRVPPAVVYVRRPMLIHVGVGYGRGIRISRYDDYWYRRDDWWRHDSRDRWRSITDVIGSRRTGVGIGVARVTSRGRPEYPDFDVRAPTARAATGEGSVTREGYTRGREPAPLPPRSNSTRTAVARGTPPSASTSRSTTVERRDDAARSGSGRVVAVPRPAAPSRATPSRATPSRGTAVARSTPSRPSGSNVPSGSVRARGTPPSTGTARATAKPRGK